MGWLEWLPEVEADDAGMSTGLNAGGSSAGVVASARASASVGVGADTHTTANVGGDTAPAAPPRLCVVDKGRLAPGQRVTWVIQGDGLQVWPPAAQADQPDVWCARLTELRHLGDLSLATLALVRLPGVELHMTLAGPQRLQWAVGQTVCIKLDPAWVHVMPMRTA